MFDPPEPIPGPAKARPAKNPGAAVPRGDGEMLVEQSRTLVRRQLDPRQTQPESPGTTRQLLDEKNGQQVRLANCLLI